MAISSEMVPLTYRRLPRRRLWAAPRNDIFLHFAIIFTAQASGVSGGSVTLPYGLEQKKGTAQAVP